MGSCDGRITTGMDLMSLNRTLMNDYDGNFYGMCIKLQQKN